jgi:predicted O-methyltransferase YrrM
MSDLDALRQRCALLEQQIAGLGNFPPGHYYSPIPSLEDVTRRAAAIWRDELPRTLPGVDLNEAGQLTLMDRFVPFYAEQPFAPQPRAGLRYGFDNVWFCHADALALYCMIRTARPRRIVEVGSGYSSAVMLDTNDRFFGGAIACTFIEPEPERLQALLREGDAARHTIVTRPVQDVGLEVFASLAADDILFVDSSHVSKVGSDVNRVFFEILPALAPGVLVHFHDIGYPFEYPREWVFEGRAWNEAYLLRAFLQYNSRFRVEWFNPFLVHWHRDRFAREMPLFLENPGGSLWLRKLVAPPGRGEAAGDR